MHPWLVPLYNTFKRHAHAERAEAMSAYMKGHFPYFGIMTTERRRMMKEHIAALGLPALDDLPAIVRSAFTVPQRELHQVAVDLLLKYASRLGPEYLPLVEDIITTKSWWDSVDALALHVVGVIFRNHPKKIAKWNKRWITTDDLWLNRTAIIFQLTWKADTDRELLFANIERHASHTDFFIRKAIGWSLRTLAQTDPIAVNVFVGTHKLSPLSEREALRKLQDDRLRS